MAELRVNRGAFWAKDLEDLEGEFLNGHKITSLPTTLDARVPTQGSVLLDKVINIDDVVPRVGWFAKFFGRV